MNQVNFNFKRVLIAGILFILSFSLILTVSGDAQEKNTSKMNGEAVVTRWMDPLGRQRPRHEVVHYKEPLKIETLGEKSFNGTEAALFATGRILILVHANIYDAINSKLNQYIADLNADGFSVKVGKYYSGSAESVRSYVVNLYGQTESLVGTVLIGDIPYIIFEMMQDWDGEGIEPPEYEDFPCDLFYMDLDGIWSDILNEEEVKAINGKYDTRSGNIELEIWVSRMKTSNLTSLGSETWILNKYFDKNHRYRTGVLKPTKQALVYNDDDWEYLAPTDSADLSWIYENSFVKVISDPEKTTADDYKNNQLTANYELMFIRSHGTPNSHGFYQNNQNLFEYIFSIDYLNYDPKALFYSFFVCSGSDYTASDNIAGTVAFNSDDSGLLSWGSTKTGGMFSGSVFYTELSAGEVFGEAFKLWFNSMQSSHPDLAPQWWYGMVLIGDGALSVMKQSRQLVVTAPNGGENWVSGNTYNITWSSYNTSGIVKIQYTTDGGSSWNYITTNKTDDGLFQWNIPNGINSTQCKIKIIDVNYNSCYDESDGYFTINSGTFDPPQNLVAISGQDSKVPLKWDAPSGMLQLLSNEPGEKQALIAKLVLSDDALYNMNEFPMDAVQSVLSGYEVFMRIGSSGSYNLIANLPASSRNYTETGLTNGTTYYFYVKAVYINPAGVSAASNIASATPRGNNLALNCPVTVSTTYGSYSGSLAVDGNSSTYWRSANGSSSSCFEWIYVDLVSVYNVDKVVVDWHPSFYATNYTIQTWDGNQWIFQKTISDGSGGIVTIQFTNSAMTQYVAVGCDIPNSSYYTYAINEFEVYASASNQTLSKTLAGNIPSPPMSESAGSTEKLSVEKTQILGNNYPNPFNPETNIAYQLPEKCHVTIKIYNMMGQEIKTLVNEYKKAGSYTSVWNGLDNFGKQVVSGIYIYQIKAGSYTGNRKMMLLK